MLPSTTPSVPRPVASAAAVCVTAGDGAMVGAKVGIDGLTGAAVVGCPVGSAVGWTVGTEVGATVRLVGAAGAAVIGCPVGAGVGCAVGAKVGAVGDADVVGAPVGWSVGRALGGRVQNDGHLPGHAIANGPAQSIVAHAGSSGTPLQVALGEGAVVGEVGPADGAGVGADDTTVMFGRVVMSIFPELSTAA